MAYVYMLLCEGNTLYTGIAADVKKRISEHINKSGAKYTKSHVALRLEALWEMQNLGGAAKLEYRIKRLDKQKKLELVKSPQSVSRFFPELIEIGFEAKEPHEITEINRVLFCGESERHHGKA